MLTVASWRNTATGFREGCEMPGTKGQSYESFRQYSRRPSHIYTFCCDASECLGALPECVSASLYDLIADLEEEGFWRKPQESGKHAAEVSELQGDIYKALAVDGKSTLFLIVWRLLRGLAKRFASNQKIGEGGQSVSLTIVRENYHIDPIYRDCYYSCYSKQHSDTLRYSQRLCFFEGTLDARILLMEETEFLQKRFLGCCVLNPVAVGSVGRTLIDPRHFDLNDGSSLREQLAYARIKPFRISMMGRSLSVESFPWRSQDGVMLRCAEVTLINLIEYYANVYKEYAFVLGSQVHDYEVSFLNERTIPAKGISYLTASKILSAAGFLPRLHSADSQGPKSKRFKRVFHHYIESGIPVAINVSPGARTTGHSLLCVGHGSADSAPSQLTAKRIRDSRKVLNVMDEVSPSSSSARLEDWKSSRGCDLYFSADFYNRYVVVDDNQLPFRIRPFEQLSLYKNMNEQTMLVALHERIMLDGYDAEDCMLQVLADDKMGIFNWADEDLCEDGQNERLVLRLFLASSRTFKERRLEGFRADGCVYRASTYAIVPFPHFVWVGELYRFADYESLACGRPAKAFGEVVLDATFGRNKDIDDAVVLWNFPRRIGYRLLGNKSYLFDATVEGADKLIVDEYSGIMPFDGNLKEVG